MNIGKEEHESAGDKLSDGNGDDSFSSLYDILPPELWEIILEQLEPRTDLLNCLEACPELEVAARPFRTIYLLNQVLPLIFPWMKIQELLLLRFGCKFYAESLVKFIQAENSRRMSSTGYPQTASLIGSHFTCPRSEKLTNFLNESQGHLIQDHTNPFLSHAVSLTKGYAYQWENAQLPQPLGEQRFWTNVHVLSSRFGNHIHFLQLDLNLSPLRGYLLLHAITREMANLRNLHLQGPSSYRRTGNTEMLNDEVISTYPLHPLSLLNSLCVNLYPCTAALSDLLVTKYFGQLSRLECGSLPEAVITRGDGDATNLKYFCLWGATDGSMESVFSSQLGTASDLENVTVYLDPADNHYNILGLLRGISKYPKVTTLQIFTEGVGNTIHNYGIRTITMEDILNAQIATIKAFKIEHSQNVDYGFLKCFPNLENVSIDHFYDPIDTPEIMGHVTEMDGKEDVEIHQFVHSEKHGGLYQSNIWRLLPFLQEVTYRLFEIDRLHDDERPIVTFKQVCTRKGYETYLQNNGAGEIC